MLRYVTLLTVLITLTHCGRQVQSKSPVNQSTPSTGNSSPTSGSSPSAPSSSPTPSAGLKWTDQELTDNTNNCAKAGSSDYSYQTWQSFCRCTYTAAAKKWTLVDFQDNFDTYFDTLTNDGVIDQCLSKAGIYY